MSGNQSRGVDKEEAQAERRSRREKRQLKATATTYAIVAMAVIFYGDVFGLDQIIYFVVGGIDGIVGGDMISAVKGSLSTIKFVGFAGAAGFAYYTSKINV